MEREIFGRKMIVENEEFPLMIINPAYFNQFRKAHREIPSHLGSESERIAQRVWNYKQLMTLVNGPKTTTERPEHPPVWSFHIPEYEDDNEEVPPLPKMDVGLNLNLTSV